MALVTYLPTGFSHLHENQMFDVLVGNLQKACSGLSGSQYLVGNVMFEGEELDAFFIKRDAICVIEMKHYGGKIHFSENAEWFADEVVVQGGRQGNPYRQVRANKFTLLNYLQKRENQILRDKRNVEWGHISALVLFGKDIHFDERLPINISPWFHICDQRFAAAEITSLHSPVLRLEQQEADAIIQCLELNEQHRYSDKVTTGNAFVPAGSEADLRRLRVVYHKESAFREAQIRMRQAAGSRCQGAVRALTLLSELGKGINKLQELPHHNDSRIPNCVIYRINNRCDLLMIETPGAVYPFYLGEPSEVIEWLNANEGLTLTVDGTTRRIVPTVVGDDACVECLAPQVLTTENTNFLVRVSGIDLNALVPQMLVRRHLEALNDTSIDNDIIEVVEAIPNEDVRNFLFDVISLLRAGELQAASARIRLRNGSACPVEDAVGLSLDAVASDANSDQILILNQLGEKELDRLLDPRRFQEWMLFLHPDQKRVAEADFDRPVVLSGVSGSGKTCILIHRARYLAKKYPGEPIGILTLNRALAHLLNNLVSELCIEGENSQIQAMAFYDYFKELLHEIGPDEYLDQLAMLAPDGAHIHKVLQQVNRKSLANEIDSRSGETLDDTWDEFYRHQNSDIRSWCEPLDKYLDSYRIDNSRYLQEEFTLIRSALMPPEREELYLKGEGFRAGRSIPFTDKIKSDILRLLLFYEEHMLAGGMLDVLELTQALTPAWRKIRSLVPTKRFRCLLIDEFQDLSTLDLRLLQHVPTNRENGLFLAGDTVQKIMVKRLRLSDAALDKGSAKHIRITKNYRNSRQVLEAASILVNEYGKMAGAQSEEIEVLDPEFAVRETNPPVALKTDDQIIKAWEIAHECVSNGAKAWTICIATAAPDCISAKDILALSPLELNAMELTGDHIKSPETLVVCNVNEIKGFEFNCVIVLGCKEGTFPAAGVPRDEIWRDALRLYVAMTRARDQVYLLYDNTPSEFLQCMKDFLVWKEEKSVRKLTLRKAESSLDGAHTLTALAKSRISKLCASKDEESASTWFDAHEYEALNCYFARHVYRKDVQETATFREWLIPKNLRNLDRLKIHRMRDLDRKTIRDLEMKLKKHGIVLGHTKSTDSNESPDRVSPKSHYGVSRTDKAFIRQGRCRSCGATAMPSEDYCYDCKSE